MDDGSDVSRIRNTMETWLVQLVRDVALKLGCTDPKTRRKQELIDQICQDCQNRGLTYDQFISIAFGTQNYSPARGSPREDIDTGEMIRPPIPQKKEYDDSTMHHDIIDIQRREHDLTTREYSCSMKEQALSEQEQRMHERNQVHQQMFYQENRKLLMDLEDSRQKSEVRRERERAERDMEKERMFHDTIRAAMTTMTETAVSSRERNANRDRRRNRDRSNGRLRPERDQAYRQQSCYRFDPREDRIHSHDFSHGRATMSRDQMRDREMMPPPIATSTQKYFGHEVLGATPMDTFQNQDPNLNCSRGGILSYQPTISPPMRMGESATTPTPSLSRRDSGMVRSEPLGAMTTHNFAESVVTPSVKAGSGRGWQASMPNVKTWPGPRFSKKDTLESGLSRNRGDGLSGSLTLNTEHIRPRTMKCDADCPKNCGHTEFPETPSMVESCPDLPNYH